jgi:siroheme synthase (precorrin-2 oxidase/ferrochelatase)
VILGGIVTKGNVKIAISTNGKSPTTAKLIARVFEDVIPGY